MPGVDWPENCLVAIAILFPIQLFVMLTASKEEYGQYSLESAFSYHQNLRWWKIILYGALLWGFAGIMSVTILPLEEMPFAPIAERLSQLIPPYFDWTNMDYLQQYPRNILLLTCGVYFVVNGLIGPIVEELFFRGYLTAKISRFGDYNWQLLHAHCHPQKTAKDEELRRLEALMTATNHVRSRMRVTSHVRF